MYVCVWGGGGGGGGVEAFKAAGVFQTFERFKCNYVFDSQSLPHTMCKIFKMVQTVFKVLKHTYTNTQQYPIYKRTHAQKNVPEQVLVIPVAFIAVGVLCTMF